MRPRADGAEPKALRVAVITAEWGPPWNEGVRNITRCLVEFLRSNGTEVSVVAPPWRDPGQPTFGIRIPLWRSIVFGVTAAHRARRLGADVVVSIASLSSALGLRSWLLRRWTRTPLLLYLTGRRRLTFGYRILLRADTVLLNSPALEPFFPRAVVVPPVTEKERWKPAMRSAPPERPVILFLGALERCRGVEYLIRAMDHLPEELDATLRVAWNGVGRHRYARILQIVGESRVAERIEFVESADVPRLYAEAAVVVIPRVAPERMAFPVRIVEAVSMGVPLVVTRINRMDQLVEGCGLAVPPRDPEALGAALTQLLTDRDLYARLADGCLEKARVWDSTRSLEAFSAAILRCR